MPTIHIVRADGSARDIAAAEGTNVMQAVTTAGESGIVAECGGSAMCATCHVYVDETWAGRLPAPLANELEMLECTAAERGPTSRLSCQIKITGELDGLVVRLPDRQQ
jgi:ferredoxin, 2Fe-2S